MTPRIAGMVFSIAAVAVAQQPAPVAPRDLAPSSLTRVLVDQPAGDVVQVLAPGYKAEFRRDGVTFTPYFGAHAPRNFPLAMQLAGVRRGHTPVNVRTDVPPCLAGEHVVYDRGSVREVWDLRSNEVEQSFVLDDSVARDAAGDLVVSLAVTSELACEDATDGLAFTQPGLGHVLYGDVETICADGARVRTRSVWRSGHIELTVPHAFVASARGAITIDPVIRSVPVNTGNDNTRNADIAYDRQNDRWLVVYERVFSGLDADIIGRGFFGNGDFLNEHVIAAGAVDARNPSVGNNDATQLFLVAWDEDRGGAGRAIMGRRETGSLNVGAPPFTLRAVVGATCLSPAVGGSTATDANGNLFAVVCEEGTTLAVTKVTTQEVVTVSGRITDPRVTSRRPAITKTRATGAAWLIAYLENVTGGSELDVLALPGDTSPAVRTTIAAVDQHGRPSIAGDGSNFLVVNSRPTRFSDLDVFGVHLRATGTQVQVVATHDLTTREPGAQLALAQHDPVVSHDGCRFAYAYLEPGAGSGDDVFAATVLLGSGAPTHHDGHQLLINSNGLFETNPVLASSGEMGGPRGPYFFACDQIVGTGNTDVVGAIYHGTINVIGVRTVRTACALFDDSLVVAGPPALGNTVHITLAVPPGAAPLLLIGNEIPPVPLCSLCRLGVSPLVFLPLGTLDWSIACDPNLLGLQVAVQGVAVIANGGCTPPSTPVALRVSDTKVLTVQ